MGHRQRSNDARSGFAMVIIAALFTAFAVIAMVVLDNKTVTAQLTARHDHQVQLAKLQTALTHYLLKEGRLPCPARYSVSPNDSTMADEYGTEMHPIKTNGSAISAISDCSKAVDSTSGWSRGPGIDVLTSSNSEYIRGMIPFKALGSYGITEDDVYDAQGNRIMYIVNRQLTGGQGATSTDTANDFVNGTGATLGNATGVVSERAQLTDKITNTTLQADFLIVSYGDDRLGGLGRNQAPYAKNITCDQSNPNIKQKLLNCTLTPTVACSRTIAGGGTSVTVENCDNNLTFINMPKNTSSQSTVANASYSNTTYFDDDVLSGSVTCPNGTLTRNEDGQCSNTYCWGNNSAGQLGNGTQTGDKSADSLIPTAVNLPQGVTSFQAIGIGELNGSQPYSTVCAITGNAQTAPYGDVYCWGKNAQIVSGTATNSKLPLKITPPSTNFKFTNIQVGYYSSCGMGGVLSGGVVNNDGKIYCWGNNQYGQLGNGAMTASWTVTPTAVSFPSGVSFYNNFSGDGYHWCAVGNNNKVYCWGKNDGAQLGTNSGAGAAQATPIDATGVNSLISAGSNIAVSVGGKGTTVLLNNGSIMGWGNQWIANSPYAIDISTLGLTSLLTGSMALNGAENTRDTTGFASGANQHQCVSLANAGVPAASYCRLHNNNGQLGNDSTATSNSFALVQMPSGVILNTISTGNFVSCGLGSDGQAYCWGANNYGQLGTGYKTSASANYDAHTPTKVKLPGAVTSFIAVAAGGTTNCALTQP